MSDTTVSVRIKMTKEQELDFTELYESRKEGEKTLTPPRLIYSWLMRATIGEKAMPGTLPEDPGSELLYRRMRREGFIEVNGRKIRPEDLHPIPDGTWDGTDGILVAIGERLLPMLRRSAQVTEAMLRVQGIPVDFVDLQGYANKIVREQVDRFSIDLARADLGEERDDLFAPPKKEDDKKDEEKKP